MTRFEFLDGWLYLTTEDVWALDGTPVRSVLKWKMCRAVQTMVNYEWETPEHRALAIAEITSKPVKSNERWSDDGRGEVYWSQDRGGFKFFLLGSRVADIQIREPFPCPRVRKGIETRWNDSQGWQKYLKSEGWVTA